MMLQPRHFRWARGLAVMLCMGLLAAAPAHARHDDLASWNDGPAKKSIVDFVKTTTDKASPDYVPPGERIATFDNDGTLWSEQPMYVQGLFALDRVKALAPQHPEWQTQEPFASILKGDLKAALAGGEKALLEIVMATHAGMTADEFQAIVKDWIVTAKNPVTKRPVLEMVYQPMVELLSYLRAHGYKTFIVSGGGIEFMRPWAEKVYGVPPSRWLAPASRRSTRSGTARPYLSACRSSNFIDDKDGKPVGINQHIGRRPVAAFGNSDGDRQMLEYATHRQRPAPRHAGAARRQGARVRLRPGDRVAGQPCRHVPAGLVRRGEAAGLDRHQHERRLEAGVPTGSRFAGKGLSAGQ